MNAKESLYAVIGGCVGAVLTMVVCSFSPLAAQSRSDDFGKITCTGLTVVHPESGEKRITLSPFLGLRILDLGVGSGLSGGLKVVDTKGKIVAAIFSGEHGGVVGVYDNKGQAVVGIDSGEHGGLVEVYGRGDSKGQAVMGVNEYGNGTVRTWDKNGYRQ